MRRALFAVNQELFGGPHNQVLRLAGPLKKRGWDIAALLPAAGSGSERLSDAGIPCEIASFGRPRVSRGLQGMLTFALGIPGDLSGVEAAIRKQRADVVIVCGLTNLQPGIAARHLRLPLIWQFLGTVAPPMARAVLAPLAALLSDGIMTTGRGVADAHPGTRRLAKWRPFIPPVDTTRFRPATQDEGRERLTIGTVGNLNWLKGHEILVEAFSSGDVADRAKLVIAGEPSASHAAFYRTQVIERAAELGLTSRGACEFRQVGDHVAEFLRELDIFVLPSHTEGLPTALLEAMATGLPVIASDVGGVPEVIEDGVNGILVPPKSPQRLASAIGRLMADPAERAKLGRAAMEWVRHNASAEICADTHAAVFDSAMRSRAKAS